MSRRLILEVVRKEDLSPLLDEIHDWWFDLDRVPLQSESRFVMELREDHRDFERENPKTCKILEVHNVTGVEIKDSNRVGYYDINMIYYEKGYVEVTTGVPLHLRFKVAALQLRLYDCHGNA